MLLAVPGHAADTLEVTRADTTTIVLDEIVVTASRTAQSLENLPGNVTVLTRRDLARSPGRSVDGVLNALPGFGLFRRTSSEVAHPTSQGVSLRGIGASGTSRTLVMLDGMPLNDPFGGWVQWGKVRLASLDRLEVLRGGATHAWGNYALGGVIALESRRPRKSGVTIGIRGGNGGTVSSDVALTLRRGRTSLSVDVGQFHTSGYALIRERQRGAIDGTAGSRNASGRIRLHHTRASGRSILLQAGGFDESRDNGTPLTGNGTKTVFASARFSSAGGEDGRLSLSAFGQAQRFRSFFSSQVVDRSSEGPALDQYRVPSWGAGASGTWQRLVADRHLVSVGADARFQSGETNERFFFSDGMFLRERNAGGDQQVYGAFVRLTLVPDERTHISVGVRSDLWRANNGFRKEREIASGNVRLDTDSAPRSEWLVNPQVGIKQALSEHVSAYGSGYRTFRGTTLNELYRPFRVRSDITAANASLEPERLTGVEAGLRFERDEVTLQAGGFWNDVDDLVVNRTIGMGPGPVDPCGFVPGGGICRQRDNVAGSRMRGVEFEAEIRRGGWTATTRYALTDSRFTDTPRQLSLEDKRLPQVARHRAVVSVGRLVGANAIEIRMRYVGQQYEDDLNTLPLDDFAVVDVAASREVGQGFVLTAQIENVFDATYPVGFSGGLETVGAPWRFTIGVQFAR